MEGNLESVTRVRLSGELSPILQDMQAPDRPMREAGSQIQSKFERCPPSPWGGKGRSPDSL